MPTINVPDYGGGSLVNLVAELELRLTGASASPPLHPHLADLIAEGATYVLFLIDGLGDDQLSHPACSTLRDARVANLDAPFPATTTVSLATIATGLPPSQHGLLGYQLWIEEVGRVVNTIRWTTLWGEPVPDLDPIRLLPSPNLWERLTAAGIDPIAVQPANFEGSGLTQALYRGCRFEPAHTIDELVSATLQLAEAPGRLILTYLPHVDFAAHTDGQTSQRYEDAIGVATGVWATLAAALPAQSVLVATADHGHIDFPSHRQHRIGTPDHENRIFYGDGRAMFVKGEDAGLAARLPATWVPGTEAASWWGPPPRHVAYQDRAPDGVLLADDDMLLLHRHSDDRLIGNHGAMARGEQQIPLLTRPENV